MSVSKEVQDVLDKARAAQTYRKSTDAAMTALHAQNDNQAKQIADLTAKLQAIPTDAPISADDKAALIEAAQDLDAGTSDTATVITDAGSAIHDNIQPDTPPIDGAAATAQPVPVGHAPGSVAAAAGDVIHTDAQLAANGPANAPAGGLAPLMPNSAFDPSPNGVAAGADGQPSQLPAVETSGGFVVSGGGTTARAPGSMPDSPSSSVVVPSDPDAKAPNSTADVAKTGVGDSGQNALTNAQGEQVIRDDVSGQVAMPVGGQPAPASPPKPADDPAVQDAQAAKVEAKSQMDSDLAAKQQAAADQASADQKAEAAKTGEQVQNPS